MIKRMNKVTSLLIAAAAIVSLVPATGVSAADRLETKSGTIETAIAFNGGNYIYDGYKTEDDESGVYYNVGTADKLLEDVNSGTMTRFGDKYVSIDDGDEYLVDLSTGKVVEETTEDKIDTVKTKLKTALGRTDRYGKVTSIDDVTVNQITKDQFGATWYAYTTTGAAATTGYSGYANEDGKYIDTDVTANIYVLNAAKTKMVKIEKFNDEETDDNITVKMTKATTIAQDNDYIYRVVNVEVKVGNAAAVPATYVQKISKAQGEKEEDAYLPNSVTSYEISNAYDSEDADDADKTLDDAILAITDNVATTNADIRVINGNIYVTSNSADNKEVTVTTIKLKKDKVSLDADTTKAKLDVYLAEQGVQKDQDIARTEAVSIDANGNTWAIYKGEILKFDGTAFTNVYDCDRSFDTLEVYNADSLIAWEDGQDGYVTVNKKATEIPVETPVQTTGWVNTASGWTFFNAAGSQVKGQWVNDGGVWYMIKADGIMATGWYNDNGTWYFLNASGAMKTGWVNDNGTWYFLQSSGAMKTGWLNDNGTWYYLNASGAMAANTTVDGYKLNASGA